MGGWTAESDASEILSNMGISTELHHALAQNFKIDKVKVLLAQALFWWSDYLLLDEPTNDIDALTITCFRLFGRL